MEFDDFLKGRVSEWYKHEDNGWYGRRIGILEYLGMTLDEYARWVTDGVIAPRMYRIWNKTHKPGT